MPTVFKYKVYDINTDKEKFVDAYATEEFIEQISGAVVLRETHLDVESEQLDCDGKLKLPK